MFNLFLIIHAILALTLIVIILLQRSDGGALGGIGGGSFSGMLTGRSSANFLTKLTAVIAALFLGNSLLLAILSGNLKDKSGPSITKTILADDNSAVTVTLSEKAFNTGSGSGTIEASDFVLTMSNGVAELTSQIDSRKGEAKPKTEQKKRA